MNPKVSIVVLNWNGLNDTIECLESLKKITYSNYEVIVVDNGSKGNDVNILENKYREYIKIIKNKENLGFTGGNNKGIQKAIENGESKYILLLNNDTIVEPNFLTELVKVAEKDEQIAIVGSIIINYYTKEVVFTNGEIDKKLKIKARLDYLNSSAEWWETRLVNGASMMFKVEYILKYDLFLNDDLFLNQEEVDLSIRVRKERLKLAIAGKSKVYHKEGRSTGGGLSSITVYYTIRNRILLAKKFLSWDKKIIFWVLFLFARSVRSVEWFIMGKWNLILITYFAFLDGIKGISGKTKRKLD